MATSEAIVREVRADDDFGQIHDLILETKRNASRDKRLSIRSAEKLRSDYFPEGPDSPQPESKGFVIEEDGRITAFMGVHPRKENGILDYGVNRYDLPRLNALLNRCEQIVLERGGTKLFYFASTQFAQIRNREISVLERLGFESEEFARTGAFLSLNYWKEPEQIDSSRIVAETDMEKDDIYRMMAEDDNETDADVFKHQLRTAEPSNVILTLRGKGNDIAAIAYYKVKKVNPQKDELSATAFNVHFRPRFELHRSEKKRFVQAVLHSMKQLGLNNVTATFSLKHVDVLTLLVQEGFHDFLGSMLSFTKTLK
ncbi:hypothetical protein [Paenibacillus sp. GYB003]|uniref:hypothetical protein n=1 Tax=Paenibacillus sp. GYB003 TaxID=2994392 RepID=UPI002F96325C